MSMPKKSPGTLSERFDQVARLRLDTFLNNVALLGFAALLTWGIAALIESAEADRVKRDTEFAAVVAARQMWFDNCRLSGGYIYREKWVEELPFRKKAQRYRKRYRTYCVR